MDYPQLLNNGVEYMDLMETMKHRFNSYCKKRRHEHS